MPVIGTRRTNPNHVKGQRPVCVNRPTSKQIRYAELYLAGNDRVDAYHGAGYKDVSKKIPRLARRDIYNIHNSKGVQFILNAVVRDTLKEMCITTEALIAHALRAYDNADTIREQIDALRLITDLITLNRKD